MEPMEVDDDDVPLGLTDIQRQRAAAFVVGNPRLLTAEQVQQQQQQQPRQTVALFGLNLDSLRAAGAHHFPPPVSHPPPPPNRESLPRQSPTLSTLSTGRRNQTHINPFERPYGSNDLMSSIRSRLIGARDELHFELERYPNYYVERQRAEAEYGSLSVEEKKMMSVDCACLKEVLHLLPSQYDKDFTADGKTFYSRYREMRIKIDEEDGTCRLLVNYGANLDRQIVISGDLGNFNKTKKKFGLSPEERNALPVRQITSSELATSATCSCCICLVDFSFASKVKALPCGHIFHSECINPHLVQSRQCPLCRIAVVVSV